MAKTLSEIWLVILASWLLVPVAGSWLVSAIIEKVNQRLMQRFGNNSLVVLSGLGVMVHELSHALVALIFLHKVTRLVLLQRPFVKDHAGKMGYVAHTWNKQSQYQQIGNFFIGIAPVFGISLAMVGVTQLLWPSLLQVQTQLTAVLINEPWWKMLLWLFIVINLLTAVSLSKSDWQGAGSGVFSYIVFLTLVTIGITLLKLVSLTQLVAWLWLVVAFFALLLSMSIILYIITRFI
ncbi:MAG: hypothetical protein LBT80_04830 [Lactobacillaceae bacterium]|jgi:hypothetical protein|nr:hypothetical protein [Lactobacillaceae bacterium]